MGADQSGDGILVVADGWLCVCVYDVYYIAKFLENIVDLFVHFNLLTSIYAHNSILAS